MPQVSAINGALMHTPLHVQTKGFPQWLPLNAASLQEKSSILAFPFVFMPAQGKEGHQDRNIPHFTCGLLQTGNLAYSHSLMITPLSETFSKTHPALGLTSSSVKQGGCSSPVFLKAQLASESPGGP